MNCPNGMQQTKQMTVPLSCFEKYVESCYLYATLPQSQYASKHKTFRIRERFEKCHSGSNSCRRKSDPSSIIYIQGSSGPATTWGQQNACLTYILVTDWELTRQLYHWVLTTAPIVIWFRSANHDTGMIGTFLPSPFVLVICP